MFDALVFAAPKPALRFTTISEAFEASQNYTVSPHIVTLGDLKIADSGLIANGIPDQRITLYGFQSFCKILGIPDPFRFQIPLDLLLFNMRRLIDEKAGEEVALLLRPDGDIASIVKTPYAEISYPNILGALQDREGLKYVDLTENLMSVGLTFDSLGALTGKGAEDVFYVGTFLWNSITKAKKLSVTSGFYRTSCTNSYLLPVMGRYTANYDVEDEDLRLSKFLSLIDSYDTEVVNRVQADFTNFVHGNLNELEASKLWSIFSTNFSAVEADEFFGFDEEARKDFLAGVQKKLDFNKRARLLNLLPESIDETTFSRYNVINELTLRAQEFSGLEKAKLEEIAGKWMTGFMLN